METSKYVCCVAYHTDMATCINGDDSDNTFCTSYCATAQPVSCWHVIAKAWIQSQGYVVDKVALGKVSVLALQFLPVYYFISAP
jgi:hypothetical protein